VALARRSSTGTARIFYSLLFSHSPLFKDYGDGGDDHDESYGVIPADGLLQVEHREHGKDQQRDYFLDGLELRGAELVGADAVGRDLEAIFEEGDHPADDNYLEQRHLAVFQVAVPGEGHEDVGDGEQGDGSHEFYSTSRFDDRVILRLRILLHETLR
jgi:hypothetical protein